MYLTVENTGGSGYATGIHNSGGASPKLSHVTAIATSNGGVFSYGVFNNSASPTMTNVIAHGSGSGQSIGVKNDNAFPTMTNVTATASGGTNSFGVFNDVLAIEHDVVLVAAKGRPMLSTFLTHPKERHWP